MNVADFAATVAAAIRHNLDLARRGGDVTDYEVPMGWGDPGLGKTEVIKGLASRLGDLGRDLGDGAEHGEGWRLVTADLVTRDPADLGGMPWVENGRSIRCRPDWLPTSGRGILFLDELPQAGQANMNIAATLIREHRIGEHELPRGWMVVGAGNHLHNHAGTTAMPSHVRSRLLHIEVEPDATAWAAWAASRRLDPMLIAYNRFRAAEYHHMPSRTEKAYPCPRTWAKADAVLRLALPESLIRECLDGTVGPAASADFHGFARVFRTLPDVDAILHGPDTGPIPADAMTLYALMGALAHRARPSNFAAVLRYLERLPEQEFAVACVRDATARDAGLTMTTAYQVWASRHAGLLGGS